MFYDKVDKINVWNRLWLSAKATGAIIISAIILGNHLHLTVLFLDDEQRKKFKAHFRLSITQYHNLRYKVHGTLGTRHFNHSILKDIDDIRDCVCYHIRNVIHHGISKNYLKYPFSTARYVFDLAPDSQKETYTKDTLPPNLASAYLPAREQLPQGWKMTHEGMIIPPPEVFRSDIVETLFGTRDEYLKALSQRTSRESDDPDWTNAGDLRLAKDQEIVEYIQHNFRIPIPSMNPNQKTEAIRQIISENPKVSKRLLSRLFGIPRSTLLYRLDQRK